MIHVTDQLSIPQDELNFTASRSSGPGGQFAKALADRVIDLLAAGKPQIVLLGCAQAGLVQGAEPEIVHGVDLRVHGLLLFAAAGIGMWYGAGPSPA